MKQNCNQKLNQISKFLTKTRFSCERTDKTDNDKNVSQTFKKKKKDTMQKIMHLIITSICFVVFNSHFDLISSVKTETNYT